MTVIPLSDVTLSEGAGASLQVPAGKAATANSRAQQAKNPGSDRILLAQGVPDPRTPHAPRRRIPNLCKKSSSQARALPRRMK